MNVAPHAPIVLVVDDDEATLDVLSRLLAARGYAPVTATGAPQCWTALGDARPALILLDLFLPGEDGMALLQDIKADPRLAGVPVIIHTLMDRCDYRDKALALGATAYLLKPLDLRDVLDHVARLVPPPLTS